MTIQGNLTNTHQVTTKTPDGKDLVFLSGTAIVDFPGATSDFVREELAIHLAPPHGPIWFKIEQCAPVVALAAVYNDGTAVDAGWAVDWTEWTTYSYPGQGPHLLLASGIAVSDADGLLIRVSYQASVLGTFG